MVAASRLTSPIATRDWCGRRHDRLTTSRHSRRRRAPGPMPNGQRRDEPSLASRSSPNNADLSHRGARRFPRAGGWFGRLPVGVPISKYRPVAIHFMCIGQCSAPAHFNTLLTDHRLAKFQSLDRRLRLGARVPRMPMCHVFCAGLVGTARSPIKIRCQHCQR